MDEIARKIDERDVDTLLQALTDRQLARLYGLSDSEVAAVRRGRKRTAPCEAGPATSE